MKLTFTQLERHIFGAADILRGTVDAADYKDFLIGLLFLKRASDLYEARYQSLLQSGQPDAIAQAEDRSNYQDMLFVPTVARWSYISEHLTKNIGAGLDGALKALQGENECLNGVLEHISFSRKVGKSQTPDSVLRRLIDHFSKVRLLNEDFVSSDLLGAAYERLLREYSGSASKTGGEFYTPSEVCDLIARLLDVQDGMSVYDPCVGSGGLLLHSRSYLEAIGGDPSTLKLYGQDSNGRAWSTCKMNLVLNGVLDGSIENGDSLTEPLHVQDGQLLTFDRVVGNPPFSQRYDSKAVKFPERFKYGWCPSSKADMMFAQHMLASLNPNGRMAVVLPNGVLFRDGEEEKIRKQLIDADALEAVISLPGGIFYGTGVGTVILLMRPPGSKPADRQGKVLLINAEEGFLKDGDRNRLMPEHVEQIVQTVQAFQPVEDYANLVGKAEFEENDYNLNHKRYVDLKKWNEEIHDLRALTIGGMPKKEVAEDQSLVDAVGFDLTLLFVERDEKYYNFHPSTAPWKDKDFHRRSVQPDIQRLVRECPGVIEREAQLHQAIASWWADQMPHFAVPRTIADLMQLRSHLIKSVVEDLGPSAWISQKDLTGSVANWWQTVEQDLRTVLGSGFSTVLNEWVDEIAAHADNWEYKQREERLQAHLMPEHVTALRVTKDAVLGISAEDKAGARAAKAKIKEIENKARAELVELCRSLPEHDSMAAVLAVMGKNLGKEIGCRFNARQSKLVDVAVRWWEKYGISMIEHQQRVVESQASMLKIIEELGCVPEGLDTYLNPPVESTEVLQEIDLLQMDLSILAGADNRILTTAK